MLFLFLEGTEQKSREIPRPLFWSVLYVFFIIAKFVLKDSVDWSWRGWRLSVQRRQSNERFETDSLIFHHSECVCRGPGVFCFHYLFFLYFQTQSLASELVWKIWSKAIPLNIVPLLFFLRLFSRICSNQGVWTYHN